MPNGLGILFLHHDINDVVRNNLRSIVAHNPDATVVKMSAAAPLPGGYSLAATPEIERLHSLHPKRSGDWLVCSWFAQKRERCHKWWVVDWDVYVTTSVREYYQPVWQFPFVASSVRRRGRDRWGWFSVTRSLPAKYRPYAMGIVPSVYLINEEVLGLVCATLMREPILVGNAELRLCTIANWCGYPPCGFSPPNDYISWRPMQARPQDKGLYHPVKSCKAPWS